MALYFSPSKLAFYNDALKDAYVAAGSWPSDAVTVTAADQATYTTTPPAGKVLGADATGQPTWLDAPAAPPPTPAQEAAAALNGTVALTSTSTSSLDGTYAIDPETRSDMESEILNYVTNGSFIGGGATIDWPDTSGTTHTFDATQMKAFVTEIGVYVKTLKGIKAANALPSGMTSFPPNTITIA